jgi:hypothetical protein
MEDEGWTISYCLNKDGFLKLQLICHHMSRLGLLEHPKYVGREYEDGTERCEVIIYVGVGKDFPNIGPLVVSTIWCWFKDVNLPSYCLQSFQVPIYARFMRGQYILYNHEIFSPLTRDSLVWVAQMRILKVLELYDR